MEVLNNIFFPLLAGHLIADFWLQPYSWVVHKKENGFRSSRLLLHAGLAAILPVLFTFQLNLWWFVPVIFATHLFIDFFKSKLTDNIATFIFDQLLHVAILFVLAQFFSEVTIAAGITKFWIIIAGFVTITNPLGIFIGKFLNKIIPDKNKKSGNLNVSAWIGILERLLILIFIVAGQFSALGFLIAAKSVFRFNDTREDGNKKAEYFLLGTLVSFTLAILVGLIVKWLIVSLSGN